VPVDELSLGSHVVTAGEAEAPFSVVASADGLAHVVATAGRPGAALRVQLLRAVLDRDWGRVIRLAERNEEEIGRRVARLVARDGAALYR
jgi:hypothetical protein